MLIPVNVPYVQFILPYYKAILFESAVYYALTECIVMSYNWAVKRCLTHFRFFDIFMVTAK